MSSAVRRSSSSPALYLSDSVPVACAGHHLVALYICLAQSGALRLVTHSASPVCLCLKSGALGLVFLARLSLQQCQVCSRQHLGQDSATSHGL